MNHLRIPTMNVTDYIGRQVRPEAQYTMDVPVDWVDITGIGKEGEDLTFLVALPDGETDSWLIGSANDYYEFRDRPAPDPAEYAVTEFLNRNGQGFMPIEDVRALIRLVRTGSEL